MTLCKTFLTHIICLARLFLLQGMVFYTASLLMFGEAIHNCKEMYMYIQYNEIEVLGSCFISWF
jgi:hypothetical protein